MKKIAGICAAWVGAATLYIASVMMSVRAEAKIQEPAAAITVYTAESQQASAPSQTGGTTTSVTEATPVTEVMPAAAASPAPDAWYLEELRLSKELQEFTYNLCTELGVPYSLVLGVMEVESGFRTDALRKGEDVEMVGLMQINSRYLPRHYERYGVDNAYEPEDNITIGVNMLAESIRKNGTVYALMEYNMGIVNMRKKRESGVTSTGYTRKVLAAQSAYAAALEEQGLTV